MRNFLFSIAVASSVMTVFAQEKDSINLNKLNEVIIQTTRSNSTLKNIPQKVEVLKKEVLQQAPANTMADVLKTKTNLDIVQYPGFSAAIGLRGFAPKSGLNSYTLVLINGKPMGSSNISTIDKDLVERVEIVKGPYSAIYGANAMGGVINIITKKPYLEDSVDLSLSYGSFDAFKVSGKGNVKLNNKSAIAFGYTHNQQKDYRIGKKNLFSSEQIKAILTPKSYGDIMKNTSWSYHQANAAYSYEINDNWQADIDVIYFNANDIKLPGSYLNTQKNKDSKKDINRINVSANLLGNFKRHKFSLSQYYNDENNSNYNNNPNNRFVNFKSNTKTYGVKFHDNISVYKNINVLAGIDIDNYEAKSERFKEKGESIAPYNPDNGNSAKALFTQVQYDNKGLDINIGGRYTWVTNKVKINPLINNDGGKDNFTTFNPSAGITYRFPSNFKLHASYGSGFIIPDAFKLAGYYKGFRTYLGNPSLKPESSHTVDFGFGYKLPKGSLNMDITYFQTWHKDKIIGNTLKSVVVNNTIRKNVSSYKNADKANMSGLELMASTNIGTLFNSNFDLELYSNLTYLLNSKVKETLKDKEGKSNLIERDMLYVRDINANFGIYFKHQRGFTTRLNARYIGNRLENDWDFSRNIDSKYYYTDGGYKSKDRILQHPSSLIFDYSLGYKIKQFYIGVNVSNLLDENYTEKDGYNMPGRQIMANLRYKL